MPHASLQSRVVHLDDAAHHGGLREASDVTMLLWHASEGDESAQGTIHYLNTTEEKTASYTFVIDRDGMIYRMARVNLITYHAGDSAWPNPVHATRENPDRPNGGHSVNRVSIGICFANNARNRGVDADPITEAQRESACWLASVLMDQYPIARSLTHAEVSPGRKVDPGPAISGDEIRAMLDAYLAAA